jgi:hypothetical protein
MFDFAFKQAVREYDVEDRARSKRLNATEITWVCAPIPRNARFISPYQHHRRIFVDNLVGLSRRTRIPKLKLDMFTMLNVGILGYFPEEENCRMVNG